MTDNEKMAQAIAELAIIKDDEARRQLHDLYIDFRIVEDADVVRDWMERIFTVLHHVYLLGGIKALEEANERQAAQLLH